MAETPPTPNSGASAADDDKTSADQARSYNLHLKGYTLLLVTSLVNVSAISNVPEDGDYEGLYSISVMFGAISFALCLIVILLDRSQLLGEQCNFTTALDGRLEGAFLCTLVLWWTVGVFYQTQVRGIAYRVLNIYFSSWSSWAMSLYTLNLWSSKKDILSWAELTGVSVTLKGWYVLLWSSLTVTFTSVNVISLGSLFCYRDAATLGAVFGSVSSIISAGLILVHYRLIELCTHGGWLEVCVALFLALQWTCATAVLTQEGAVSGTINGRGYSSRLRPLLEWDLSIEETSGNCSFVVPNDSLESDCSLRLYEIMYDRERCSEQAPGSNMYISVWISLIACVHIIMRWKAQQAVQFAAKAQEGEQVLDVPEDELDDDSFEGFVDAEDEE